MLAVDIYRRTLRHFLAPVWHLMEDDSVTEIMIIGPETIYVERAGRIEKTSHRFENEALLMAAVVNIAEYVNRRIDEKHHSMDARLPDGSRVHAIIPPSSRVGICLTIRKFQQSTFRLHSLVEMGSLTAEAAEFLRLAVMMRKNVVISGGTSTGKTSMLNALSATIPEAERIIVIEDSSELRLHQPHTVYLESQPPGPDGFGEVTIRDLFVDSLRMRPDRVIVGEVRRHEALDMVQAMISGHAGSMTTVHASTPRDAASRIETLCLMSDASLPVYVARSQVASAVHVVVQLARFADGSRRIQSISELLELDDRDTYQWRELYCFQGHGLDNDGRLQGDLVATGSVPSFSREPYQLGFGEHIKLTDRLFVHGDRDNNAGHP